MIDLKELFGLKEVIENRDCEVCQHYLYGEVLGSNNERPWCAVAARTANRACGEWKMKEDK